MDFDIEMGDAAPVTQDLPAEELPLADDILVLYTPFSFSLAHPSPLSCA